MCARCGAGHAHLLRRLLSVWPLAQEWRGAAHGSRAFRGRPCGSIEARLGEAHRSGGPVVARGRARAPQRERQSGALTQAPSADRCCGDRRPPISGSARCWRPRRRRQRARRTPSSRCTRRSRLSWAPVFQAPVCDPQHIERWLQHWAQRWRMHKVRLLQTTVLERVLQHAPRNAPGTDMIPYKQWQTESRRARALQETPTSSSCALRGGRSRHGGCARRWRRDSHDSSWARLRSQRNRRTR